MIRKPEDFKDVKNKKSSIYNNEFCSSNASNYKPKNCNRNALNLSTTFKLRLIEDYKNIDTESNYIPGISAKIVIKKIPGLILIPVILSKLKTKKSLT